MPKSSGTGDIAIALSVFRAGLERGGCLVCLALTDAESRALHSFLYEGMTTPPALLAFLAAGGFCPRHFRRAMRLGVNRWSVGCVELAILCRHLLPRAAAEAGEIRARRRRARLFASRPGGNQQPSLFPGRSCIFCQDWNEREARFVTLLELVAEREEFARALDSDGICVAHGTLALAAWQSHSRAERLARILQARSDRLFASIQAFLQKYDERHRHEPFGPEADALEQAADFLAGLDVEPRGHSLARHPAGALDGAARKKT